MNLLAHVLAAARAVPPGLAWWAGSLLGYAVGGLPLRDVRRARQHLAIAFPERGERWAARTARMAFRHFGATAAWTIATWGWDAARLRRGIVVEGEANLRALVAAGRRGDGTVVYAGHFGNWELLARTFGGMTPSAVIGRRLRSPAADAVVQAMRSSGGARVVYQDDDVRSLVRLLREGYLVATLADQDIPHLAGCFVPWFGVAAWTPVAPAALAQLGRAAVQNVLLYRKGGRWVLHAGPRAVFPRGSDRVADQTAITAWATAYEEQLVRRHPEQWVWWHKRWRTRPEQAGAASAAESRS